MATATSAEAEIKRAARRAAADRLRAQKHITRRNTTHRSHAFENAYYILGHGYDHSDIPAIQVPNNCIVIAKAAAGESTDVTNKNTPLYDINKYIYINPLKKIIYYI